MSYQERRALVSAASAILIPIAYTAYMTGLYPAGDAYAPDVFRFWGSFFLILIPVTIVARIAITIVFSIGHTLATDEGEPDITDERDRLIELRASRGGLYLFGVGFVAAMVALASGQPPALMFALLLCAGIASDIVSELSSFYLYRRGF